MSAPQLQSYDLVVKNRQGKEMFLVDVYHVFPSGRTQAYSLRLKGQLCHLNELN